MNTELNLKRLGFFIRRQLYLNFSTLWVGIVAITGFLLAASVLVPYFKPEQSVSVLVNLFGIVFFVCGFIFTSRIYSEMQSPQQSYTFLTLPVSTIERLLGAWLISSPLYIISVSIIFSVLMAISALIAGASVSSFFQSKFLFLNIRDIGAFMVFQTVFLLGAATFRGNNFLKTLLAVFIFFTLVAIYTGGLGSLLFGGGGVGPHNISPEFTATLGYIFSNIMPFLFWFVLPLFMLLVSYFKLKERQV